MSTPNAMPRKRIIEQPALTPADKAFLRRCVLSDKKDHPGITDSAAYRKARAAAKK